MLSEGSATCPPDGCLSRPMMATICEYAHPILPTVNCRSRERRRQCSPPRAAPTQLHAPCTTTAPAGMWWCARSSSRNTSSRQVLVDWLIDNAPSLSNTFCYYRPVLPGIVMTSAHCSTTTWALWHRLYEAVCPAFGLGAMNGRADLYHDARQQLCLTHCGKLVTAVIVRVCLLPRL